MRQRVRRMPQRTPEAAPESVTEMVPPPSAPPTEESGFYGFNTFGGYVFIAIFLVGATAEMLSEVPSIRYHGRS